MINARVMLTEAGLKIRGVKNIESTCIGGTLCFTTFSFFLLRERRSKRAQTRESSVAFIVIDPGQNCKSLVSSRQSNYYPFLQNSNIINQPP